MKFEHYHCSSRLAPAAVRELLRWPSRVMKMSTLAILLAGLLPLASCSKPERSPVVGRWHEVGTAGLVAFHEDGTVEMTLGGSEASGKYSFITDGKLKLEMIGKAGAIGPHVYQYSITGDKMTWIDVEGQKTEYLRAQ